VLVLKQRSRCEKAAAGFTIVGPVREIVERSTTFAEKILTLDTRARELIESKVPAQIGAGLRKRSDERVTHLDGDSERAQARRRWWPWCRRPVSTASRRARSTAS
jgi:hypothetical protein